MEVNFAQELLLFCCSFFSTPGCNFPLPFLSSSRVCDLDMMIHLLGGSHLRALRLRVDGRGHDGEELRNYL